MIAIIDYGAGNLLSVVNAFKALGCPVEVTRDRLELARSRAIVLPGVGAFGAGMEQLRRLDLIGPLNEEVWGKGKPYLGICLGLQFLARESLEHGRHQGLGWLAGTVVPLKPPDPRFRVPHMGWNDVAPGRPCPLFEGLGEAPVFYFVHSFHLQVEPEARDWVSATCWHGTEIVAAVSRDNIFGVQFHPEKSQWFGLKLLGNFIQLVQEDGLHAQKTPGPGVDFAGRLGSAEHPL